MVDLISGGARKIDSEATNGLGGVQGSLAYRAHEIERHVHNQEKWIGLAGVPDGEVHRADRMEGGVGPFVLLSDNDDFGAWVQILGSGDTPITGTGVYMDSHRAMVVDTDSTDVFIVQMAPGEAADLAAKIAAEQFTEFPYIAATNNNDSGVTDAMSMRVAVGTKIWARCCCIGVDAKTINLYFGMHEYEG